MIKLFNSRVVNSTNICIQRFQGCIVHLESVVTYFETPFKLISASRLDNLKQLPYEYGYDHHVSIYAQDVFNAYTFSFRNGSCIRISAKYIHCLAFWRHDKGMSRPIHMICSCCAERKPTNNFPFVGSSLTLSKSLRYVDFVPISVRWGKNCYPTAITWDLANL